MPQYTNTPSPKPNGSKTNQVSTSPQLKMSTTQDTQASQRIRDFMADPGPIPFRRETITEAQRYMAYKIKEFDYHFGGGNSSRR
ncbi:hypothetical protein N431DRAFT_469838 [Stipitochalara longipes BDJ]|nr:hypothetical protein N431DRAFT_469838 [Stipitochalara longipes BDJ]